MKIKYIILVGFMLGVAWQTDGQNIARSAYYANIPFWESQIQPFKAAIPITKEQALQRIHLRLDYDSLGRVIQSNVMIGKEYKAFQGYMKLFIDAPKIQVQHHDSTEIHTFYDHRNEQITVMNEVYQKVFDKDQYGRRVRLKLLDKNGQPAEDHFGYTRYEWVHEHDGAVIESRYTKDGELGPLRGGFQFVRTRITYSLDGFPHMLQNIDAQGELINSESGAAMFKYYYDQQGRFLRWEVYDKDGNPAVGPSDTSGEQNVYNGYYLSEIQFFDTQGRPVKHWSGAEKWVLEHDKYGNRTIRSFQTSDGNLMNGYAGFAQNIYEWSDDGRWLLSESFYDEQGQPFNRINNGVSKTEYVRDDEGVITDTLQYQYSNGQYQLIDAKDE